MTIHNIRTKLIQLHPSQDPGPSDALLFSSGQGWLLQCALSTEQDIESWVITSCCFLDILYPPEIDHLTLMCPYVYLSMGALLCPYDLLFNALIGVNRFKNFCFMKNKFKQAKLKKILSFFAFKIEIYCKGKNSNSQFSPILHNKTYYLLLWNIIFQYGSSLYVCEIWCHMDIV